MSNRVKTNLPGLICGSKPKGAVGEALLKAAREARDAVATAPLTPRPF